MSSVEIADLTGKEHNHVVRDIRVLLQQLGAEQSKFGSSYLAENGKMEPCYIGKRHDHVLRDIREMFQQLGTAPSFGGSYKDSTGRSLP